MPIAVAPKTGAGVRPHRLWMQRPGPPVPDGDGGYTNSWIDLEPPTAWARVSPASAASLERVAAGTIIASATHEVTVPYHPQISTEIRVLLAGRQLSVTGVTNPDERNVELVLVCEEIVR